MATCPNCKAGLSCGCQMRTASNGARVCGNCIGSYEISLATLKKTAAPTPVKSELQNTAPRNVNAIFKPAPRLDQL